MKRTLSTTALGFLGGLALTMAAACGGEDIGETNCTNGEDDDGDGLTDCRDDDCASQAVCQGCGNGILDGAEQCDGEDFGSSFCETMGFVGGWLACNPDCTIDTSACVAPECGDGRVDGDEQCDGLTMGDNASCQQQGFLGGTLLCNETTCRFDTAQCFSELVCSEHTVTSPEVPWCYGGPSGGGYLWIHYEWLDLDDGKEYQLQLELWGADSQPFPPGVHDLTADGNDNYRTCTVCPLLIQCADPNCSNAGPTYFPQAGSFEVLEAALANAGSFRGVLRDVEWVRTIIDWETYDSTPVAEGPCLAPDADVTFDASVIQPPANP